MGLPAPPVPPPSAPVLSSRPDNLVHCIMFVVPIIVILNVICRDTATSFLSEISPRFSSRIGNICAAKVDCYANLMSLFYAR